MKIRLRPTLLELLVIVSIVAILCANFLSGHHHHLHPLAQHEMFGHWVAIPGPYSAYRLFLTNNGTGLLGARDFYTDLWKVVSWQVTNRDISIDLAPITHPEWPPEYIRGKVGIAEIRAVRGGVNQAGERWKRDMTFYREDTVRQDLEAASAVMTNQSQIIGPGDAANRSLPASSHTNQTPGAAASGRSP